MIASRRRSVATRAASRSRQCRRDRRQVDRHAVGEPAEGRAARAARSRRCRPGRAERPPRARSVRPRCASAPRSFLRRPFRRRVPSGNITTRVTLASERRQRFAIASSSRSPRRTWKPPPASMTRLSGNQKSSDFAMKRKKRRGKKGSASGHGSKFDQWFAARTKPPTRGTFSTPLARCRKSDFRSGQLTTATRRYSQLGRGGFEHAAAVSRDCARRRQR